MNIKQRNQSDLSESVFTLPLKCKGVRGATVVWKNMEVLAGERWSDHVVVENFAYLIGDYQNVSEISTRADRLRTGYAEAYGGELIGVNGGGGRCVNINGFQIKGAGMTPFVGEKEKTDFDHVNGMYLIDEAVNEEIGRAHV